MKKVLKKKAKAKIIAHNVSWKLAEKNPESKLLKAYEESHYCSNTYVVEGGKAHSHYCHRPFLSYLSAYSNGTKRGEVPSYYEVFAK